MSEVGLYRHVDLEKNPLVWEEETIHHPAPVKTYLLPKQKICGGRRGFTDSIGFWYLPPAQKVFLEATEVLQEEFLSVVVVYGFFFPVSLRLLNTLNNEVRGFESVVSLAIPAFRAF